MWQTEALGYQDRGACPSLTYVTTPPGPLGVSLPIGDAREQMKKWDEETGKSAEKRFVEKEFFYKIALTNVIPD